MKKSLSVLEIFAFKAGKNGHFLPKNQPKNVFFAHIFRNIPSNGPIFT